MILLRFIVSFFLLLSFTSSFYGGKKKLKKKHRLQLIGHRGVGGQSYENTWRAFKKAIDSGMTSIETDLQFTRDGYFVLMHDGEVKCRKGSTSRKRRKKRRTRSMKIRSLTLNQLYNCSGKPPFLLTLPQFFDQLLGYVKTRNRKRKRKLRLRFTLDVKLLTNSKDLNSRAARRLLYVIGKFKLWKRATIQSYSIELLKAIRKKSKLVKTNKVFLPSRSRARYIWRGQRSKLNRILVNTAKKAKVNGISVHRNYVTKRTVQLGHRKGLKVFVFTLNQKKDILNFLKMGVDGIITDKPKLLARTVRAFRKRNKLK